MEHPVIVGVDAPEDGGTAVDWAADEAWLRGRRLHLVHAWPWETHQPSDSSWARAVRQSGQEMLRSLTARATDRHPDLEVTSGIVETAAREALVALSSAANLLVLGSRGTGGFEGLLTGSTCLWVTAHAACPVTVVPGVWTVPAQFEDRDGVAVGVRGRGPSDGLLAFAFEAAQRQHLPLLVAHAWSYPLLVGPGHSFPPVYEEGHVAAEVARLVAELLAGWREKYPDVAVTEDVVRSGAARHLVALSRDHQLLVVGRHGRPEGPLARLGSVSQAVVQHARCPVAVLPNE
ncbi:universal stress protein [Streptacidiphilus sp. EB129]|uniref:universal stress protein n=1 Tax=Streptacidiphilus sp. EB129 TaxID=3156262 RepID=UPI003514B6BB